MLYTPFRQCLRRYAREVSDLDGHIGPEFLEEPSREHAALIRSQCCTKRWMRILLKCFPEEPPGGFGENGPGFGPVIHQDDARIAMSVQLPLALSLDDDFPTESYGPVGLLRVKCTLLTLTIETYVGWLAYTKDESPTRWQDFPPQVPTGAFEGLTLVRPEDRHLGRLFANVASSAARCRQAVEFQFGRPAGEL